jgi:predicted DNA binding protein
LDIGEEFMVQCRVEGGGVHRLTFTTPDTLLTLINKLKEILKVTKVEISVSFPRHIFTDNEYEKTLIELQLKNASVIVRILK